MRNNMVTLLVIPLQTMLSLALAVMLNRKILKGQRHLPHGVLLPLGYQLCGHHCAVDVSVQRHRFY